MRYHTTACDLQAANDVRKDLLHSDLNALADFTKFQAYDSMTQT